jgi:hypothetical protein
MLKKTVVFKDFNGVEHSKDLYFHISKSSVLTASDATFNEVMQIGKDLEERGKVLQAMQGKIEINEADPFDENNKLLTDGVRMVAKLLDRLVDLAYGEKSVDGLHFDKSPQVLSSFKSSAVYDAFVEQMLLNTNDMLNFIEQLLKA